MIGGGTQDLGAHLLCRGMGGVAGHHRAAAREGADSPIELVGVTGHHVDVGDRDADLVSDDLSKAGEMALGDPSGRVKRRDKPASPRPRTRS
jgi:hypothetical protein